MADTADCLFCEDLVKVLMHHVIRILAEICPASECISDDEIVSSVKMIAVYSVLRSMMRLSLR